MTHLSKRLLLFTAETGLSDAQLRGKPRTNWAFNLFTFTDRCHQLEDPVGRSSYRRAFETPEAAAYAVMETLRGQDVAGILALG